MSSSELQRDLSQDAELAHMVDEYDPERGIILGVKMTVGSPPIAGIRYVPVSPPENEYPAPPQVHAAELSKAVGEQDYLEKLIVAQWESLAAAAWGSYVKDGRGAMIFDLSKVRGSYKQATLNYTM